MSDLSAEELVHICRGPHERLVEALDSLPHPEVASEFLRLLALVREEAARSNIAPELLATRRDIEQLVFGGRSDHLLRGWRREIIGERIVKAASDDAAPIAAAQS